MRKRNLVCSIVLVFWGGSTLVAYALLAVLGRPIGAHPYGSLIIGFGIFALGARGVRGELRKRARRLS